MDPIIKINKATDFDFEYKLNPTYVDSPFKITFYTIDREDNYYEAYFDGENYSNCTKTDNGSIVVHLDHPGLYCGCLRLEIEYYIDSASFEDGIYNDIRREKTNCYIVREASNTTSITYEGSDLPNFDAVNIANNVEQALNEIKDKSDELDEALETLEESQERIDELIAELIEWQDTISDLVNRSELTDYARLEDLGPYMTEDEVSDWLNNYYTKNECNTRYYTKTQIDGMLSSLQPEIDLSQYATKADLASIISGGDINLEDYITKTQLSACGYLTQHQSLDDYATMTWVHNQNYVTLDYIDENSEFHVDLDGYVKYEDLNLEDYATKVWVGNQGFLTSHQSLDGLASQSWVQNQHYLTQHQSLEDYITYSNLNSRLSSYATTEYVESRLEEVGAPDLSDYATKSYVMNAIPEQLWMRGSGSYSLITQSYNTAYGRYSLAEGDQTVAYELAHAEGWCTKAIGGGSHSEGGNTVAYGAGSHAEGFHSCSYGEGSHVEGLDTYTYGLYSHAEGWGTITYKNYEHAQGMFNKSNNNTLSSIGIGEGFDEQSRRNAFEVMQNGDIYMYGIGNYDGTNIDTAYTIKDTIDTLNDRIDNISGGGEVNLTNYVSKAELSSCGYLTSHQDLSGYATLSYTEGRYLTRHQSLDNYATKSYVATAIANAELSGGGNVDLSDYVTKTELSSCGYLTSHQSLDDYATKSYVLDKISGISGGGNVDLSSYVTKTELSACGYLTSHQSLDDYATKTWIENQGFLTSHQDISGKADKSELASYVTKNELTNASYATESYVTNQISNIQTVTYQNISIWQGTEAQYALLSDYTSYQLYLIAQE